MDGIGASYTWVCAGTCCEEFVWCARIRHFHVMHCNMWKMARMPPPIYQTSSFRHFRFWLIRANVLPQNRWCQSICLPTLFCCHCFFLFFFFDTRARLLFMIYSTEMALLKLFRTQSLWFPCRCPCGNGEIFFARISLEWNKYAWHFVLCVRMCFSSMISCFLKFSSEVCGRWCMEKIRLINTGSTPPNIKRLICVLSQTTRSIPITWVNRKASDSIFDTEINFRLMSCNSYNLFTHANRTVFHRDAFVKCEYVVLISDKESLSDLMATFHCGRRCCADQSRWRRMWPKNGNCVRDPDLGATAMPSTSYMNK